MFKQLRALEGNIKGLSTVEYTLLLVLIVAGSVKLWGEFGTLVVDRLGGAKDDFKTYVK